MKLLPSVLLLLFCCLCMHNGASAEIALLDSKADQRGTSFRLGYRSKPRQPDAMQRRIIPPEDAELDLLLVAASVDGEAAASRRESILLAIENAGIDAPRWSIRVVGSNPAAAADSLHVALSAVRVGLAEGLRVDIDPGDADLSATIIVEGPPTAPSKEPGLRLADFPIDSRILQSAFANGHSVIHLPVKTEGKSVPTLPAPPAPARAVYTVGDRILTLSQADLPTINNTRLIHHGVTLPVGGQVGSSHWFYAPRRVTLTDDSDSVFVEASSATPSPAMSSRSALPGLTPLGVEVAQTRSRLYADNLIYERATPLPLRERFVYYRILSGQSRQTSFQVEDKLTTSTVTLRVKLMGFNTTPGTSPDHYAQLSVVGYAFSSNLVGWTGRTELDFQFTAREFSSGGDKSIAPNRKGTVGATITLDHSVPSPPGAPPIDIQNLESVLLRWNGKPRLNAAGTCTLELPAAASPRLATIAGFPPGTTAADVLLLDISDPNSPVRLLAPSIFTDESGTIGIEFEAPTQASTFYAHHVNTLPAPLALQTCPILPALTAGTLRGIYVREPALAASLAPLLQNRGAGYIELDPHAAYVAYNGGQESPDAIRQALADMVASAPLRVPLPSITLVGHGTFDPRNYLTLKSGAQVPTFIDESVDTGFTIENCIDFPYGLLEGNDDLQDALVGRLPVKTSAELDVIVARILAHDTITSALTNVARPALFINDDEDVTADVGLWPTYWTPTGRPYVQIDLPDTSDGSAERLAIRNALEAAPSGPALVLYSGHGNTTFWAGELLLQATDLPTIDTQNKWPFVLTFTCLNGNYAVPGAATRTLGEAWLLTADRGAIADLAPCSVDFYDAQRIFAIRAMEQISLPQAQRPQTVGEMVTRARINFEISNPDDDVTNHLYLLFGDPLSHLTIDPPPAGMGDGYLLY